MRALGVLAAAAAMAAAGLVASLWLEHRRETTLPAPTGPLAVGRATYDWTDAAAVDALAPAPGTRRELLVWIWYPAAADGPPDDYMPAQMRAAAERALPPPSAPGWVMSRLLTRDASKVRARAVRGASVSPAQAAYPVLILRAGASLGVQNYTTLAEDLASHGYIVVGIDAPYRTGVVVFPDGRVFARTPDNNPELLVERRRTDRLEQLFAAWVGDMRFVVDRLQQLNASDPAGKFTGRFDLTRIGAFGHSFGGAQAAQFCHDDARCAAAIDIDGAPFGSVIQTGMDKPFMFLFSGEGDFSTDAEVRVIKADIQSLYDRLPRDTRVRLSIRGASHFTFTDDGAVLKSGLLRGVLRLFGKLGIDGRRQLAVTAYGVRTFFDAYLKGGRGTPPDFASPQYHEIVAID